MGNHLTLRLAWHNDGWSGRVCSKPERNSYCVGCASYPGEMIREQRDLAWEKRHAGVPFPELDRAPPCMYSASAFAEFETRVHADPPDFFRDETKTRYWDLPSHTACVWPYEAMYNKPGVKRPDGTFDYDLRLKYAEEYFESVEPGRSLVFYYANYSNPCSTDENPAYLLIGVARVKAVGPTLYYEDCSDRTLERYKGFVWQRAVTADFPEQGVRLPYHRYIDQPDVLRTFAVVPENAALCKYATRHVSDDEALGLLEQLLEAFQTVREDLKDASENWDQRITWLQSLIAELWQSRGAFPGMPAVLEAIGLSDVVEPFRKAVESGHEQEAVADIQRFVQGGEQVLGYRPNNPAGVRRKILLTMEGPQALWLDTFARIALSANQLERIADAERAQWGIRASLEEIHRNPYLLAEQYQGEDATDRIRWSKVDRGMLPSPELPATPRFDKSDPERLRALLLETLKGESQQTFLRADVLLGKVNRRIKAQPEWKQNLLTEKYLVVDADFHSDALYRRSELGVSYYYDKRVWEDERFVERVISDRLTGSDLPLKRPVGPDFWQQCLFDESSRLAASARDEYSNAVHEQQQACARILDKRFAAITGGAGTGKTTVVSTLIRAIRKVEGEGAGVAVLAPTGKATDKLRSTLQRAGVGGVTTRTIHSLLASHGWLNPNMTFKPAGGKAVQDYGTLIIDECSMIDLGLMASLFRAINWHAVKRLVLVGDAAQLPPIGIGKAYAEIVSWLRAHYPELLVSLRINLRQMENRASNRGAAILTLADQFINEAVTGNEDESGESAISRKDLIERLHEGGDIDKDLRVIYWSDPEVMQQQLMAQVTRDLVQGDPSEGVEVAQVWSDAFKHNINCVQILSPVRGDLYGTDAINLVAQRIKSQSCLDRYGSFDGITYFDKVIQVINRPASDPLYGYNFEKRSTEKVEVFNGEIGFVVPTGKWTTALHSRKRVSEFSVKFSGKAHLSVNYDSRNKPEQNLELAYAISVHKAQGSEFDRVHFVLPTGRVSAQYKELIYTALTRASQHCTLFVQGGVETLVNAMRPEQSALKTINSSLFRFSPVAPDFITKSDWYEAGKIHRTLAGDMVRSKSEVIISNILHDRGIDFAYEMPLVAADGSMHLPDFSIRWQGEVYFWEHLGMLDRADYRLRWEAKKLWYERHFPGRLFITEESADLSERAASIIAAIIDVVKVEREEDDSAPVS
ncbi:AAA family ATPase [Stenotrophomonas maltophilia]|nr:AAA family ATPase [Stenotrophomonas maltophilia]HEL4257236.1 AAA family ATPase [Stenotrophomonas maltophilia]